MLVIVEQGVPSTGMMVELPRQDTSRYAEPTSEFSEKPSGDETRAVRSDAPESSRGFQPVVTYCSTRT